MPDIKKSLNERWKRFQRYKNWLDTHPSVRPTLVGTQRPAGFSGVFLYRPSILDYTGLAEEWFPDRNKTYRHNFVRYVSAFFSTLIQHELTPDGSLKKEEGGVEVYSLDLKKLSRNYSEFNDRLVEAGFLEVHSLHDEKKGKSREYAICRELLGKGVRKEFLPVDERKKLEDSCKSSPGPDKSDSNPLPVVGYFVGKLAHTAIDRAAYDDVEIEVGRFKKLARGVHRFSQGKHDARIGTKEGRFYSGYVQAPSEFRGLMRYNGTQRLVEGDVAACHFHFLLDEMNVPQEKEQMKRDLMAADPYLAMCSHPSGVSREELKQSSHLFKFGTRADVRLFLPDYEASKVVPYRQGLFYRHLSKKYPKFADNMARKAITHKKHKSSYACELMKKESGVMVHMVGERCWAEGLVYLPIHDGFLTLPDQFDRASDIVRECFRLAVGSTPKIRKK